MKKSIVDQLKSLSFKTVLGALANIWKRIFAYVAWLLLLLVIIFISFVGYTSLLVDNADADKERLYIQSQEAKARFNEQNYEELQEIIDLRAANRRDTLQPIQDIFFTPGVGEEEGASGSS